MIKPTIVIQSDKDRNQEEVLSEILAGIEEEGVLYEVVYKNDYYKEKQEEIYSLATRLAKAAAESSQLEVGIGVYNKVALLTVHKLGGIPLLQTESEYRQMGHNAARYVKGMSFKG